MFERHLVGRGAALGLCAALFGLAGSAGAQAPGLVWSFQGDGTWVGDAISIANYGTQVFTEYGAYAQSRVVLSAHDVHPPAPVWADPEVAFVFHRVVASSREGDVHVAMHQRFKAGSTSIRRAVVRRYGSSSPDPEWTREVPVDIAGHPYSVLGLSEDGQRTLAAVFDFSQNRTRIELLHPGVGHPLVAHILDTSGPAKTFALSGDGRKLLLASDMKFMIVDVDTGTTEFSKFLFGALNPGAGGLSRDGSVAAFGTSGAIWLIERGANGVYQEVQGLTLPGGAYCRRLEVSSDGSTLAAGMNFGSASNLVQVQAYHLPSRELLMSKQFSGSGSWQNLVSRLSISADGRRFAVGLWGDEGGLVPEVLVFERDRNEPVFTYDLPGSVNALDFSPRGDYLAVASKGVHANVAGGGGAFWLFRTSPSDLGLEGVPSIGCGVAVAHRLAVGESSRVLVAPFLASQPETFGPAGTLYLDRTSMRFLAGTRVAGTDGAARHAVAIPSDATLIGSSLYYQGLDVGARRLSGDWVKMTVLP